MDEVRERYDAVYHILKEVRGPRYIVSGLRDRIDNAIDDLKKFKNPSGNVGFAERLSIGLHALDRAALCRDDRRRVAHWNVLRSLEEQWLTAPAPRA